MTLGKRIASATVQITLSRALVSLLSLVTMPVLTHLLPPEAYGVAAIAGTLISLVSVFALAGMDMSYVRAYHSTSPPSGFAVELFAWRYVIVAGTFAGLAVLAAWPFVSGFFSLPSYIGGLLAIGIVLSLGHTMALARARLNSRYKAMSVSTVVSGLGAATISIGVAYWWRQDEFPLILSMVVGYLIPILVLGTPSVAKLSKPLNLDAADQYGLFKIGLAGVVTAPAYWLLSSSDRWFLGYFEDATSVGIYSIGYGVAIIGMMANSAVTTVWVPETAREYENNPKCAQANLGKLAELLTICFACVWMAVTAAGGDLVRLLAAPPFHEAAILVPYIAAGVFFYGITHLANASLLLKKKLSLSIRWWIAGGAFCLALNFILVPLFGRLGAALTQLSSFALISAGTIFTAQKLYPLRLNWMRLGFVLVVVLVVGAVMSNAWASTPALSLLLKLPTGILAVIIVFKMGAPEVLSWAAEQYAMLTRRGQLG